MCIYIIYIYTYVYIHIVYIRVNINIHIARNILEFAYDLKTLLTVTSITFFIFIFILENQWFRYIKIVFRF